MTNLIPDEWKADDHRYWAVGSSLPGRGYFIRVEAGDDADLCPLPKFWKRGKPKTISYPEALALAKRIYEPDVVFCLCHPDDTGNDWLKFPMDFEDDIPKGGIQLISFDQIESREMDFLAYPRVPAGCITILASDGGCGKTSLACMLASAISRGENCFFGDMKIHPVTVREPGRVLLLLSEDSCDCVLKPRLEDYDANMALISTIQNNSDLEKLQFCEGSYLGALFDSYRPQLCIFDPIQSFLPSGINMSARNDMRHSLNYVKALAEKFGTTILILAHTNKRDNTSGRGRIADSSDIWDIARSVIITGHTQEPGICYFSLEKNNYASVADCKTILYGFGPHGQIERRGETEKKDSDFQAEARRGRQGGSGGGGRRDISEAEELILDTLGESGGEMPVKDLDSALKAQSLSARCIREGKKSLREKKIIYIGKNNFNPDSWICKIIREP